MNESPRLISEPNQDPAMAKLVNAGPFQNVHCDGIEAPNDRELVWKNLCMISDQECILEFSRTPKKFLIIAYLPSYERFKAIELFRQ